MMNPNLLLLKRPWWQVSLLLLVCVLLVSQGVQAQTDYKTSYPFMENPTYDSGGQYIKWSTVLFNDLKADEGFFESSTYGWGCGVHMKAGNDSYKYAGNLCCNSTGGNQRMYNIYSNRR